MQLPAESKTRFVEEQPATEFLAGRVDRIERHDLGRVEDRRIEPVFEGVMQVKREFSTCRVYGSRPNDSSRARRA